MAKTEVTIGGLIGRIEPGELRLPDMKRPGNGEPHWLHGGTAAELTNLNEGFRFPRDAEVCPIGRRRDGERREADYRRNRALQEFYDALAAAFRTGQPYQTRLEPPTAGPHWCRPPRHQRSEHKKPR